MRGGLSPDYFKGVDDLSRLPVLTKDTIFEYGERIISRGVAESEIMKFPTGGTAGQQAEMYRDQESCNIKLGLEWRHEGWMGRRPCDKTVYFWPAHVDIVEHESLKMKIKNRYILRQMVLNAGVFREDAMRSFYRDIMRFKPSFFKVFSTSLFHFTEYLEAEKLRPPRLRGIMSSGEPLYNFQKRKFEVVDNIPREKSGKIRYVICEIDPPASARFDR